MTEGALLETAGPSGGAVGGGSDNDAVVKHVGVELAGRADRQEGGGGEDAVSAERESVVGAAAGLYALTVIGLGVVFPVAFFLSGKRIHDGIYLSIFHIYVYAVALLFIFYLYVSIQSYKKDTRTTRPDQSKLSTTYKRMSELEENAAIAALPDRDRAQRPEPEMEEFPPPPEIELIPERVSAAESEMKGPEQERHHVDVECKPASMPKIQYSGKGVNFFLRMGLVAFGLGSAMLDAFRLLQFVEAADVWFCYSLLFVLHTALRLVFTLAQSFFLFKHHKVILNYHKSLMKFGLLHLVATNLVTWALTIVLEASGSFMHLDYTRQQEAQNHTETQKNLVDEKRIYAGGCYRSKTLSDEAAPYLFPFVVEFSLLAAAILYRLYSNVGKCSLRWMHLDDRNTMDGGSAAGSIRRSPKLTKPGSQCHKANSGLFPGLVVLTVVFVGMCFMLYYPNDTTVGDTGISPRGLIHMASDLLVNSITLLALVPAFCYLRQLHFSTYVESYLDQTLLVIALGGYYLLLGFMAVAAFSQLDIPDLRRMAPVLGITCVLIFAQTTLQVCFIFNGLRRRVHTAALVEKKPARSFITFLLICNLAMWVVNTFELKEVHSAAIFTEFYGTLGWTIIMHICLPLAIYFRFHASVCLSDIWLHAYKLEEICMVTPGATRTKQH